MVSKATLIDAAPSEHDPAHVFACLYQIERAYYQIFENIVGSAHAASASPVGSGGTARAVTERTPDEGGSRFDGWAKRLIRIDENLRLP